MRKWLYKLQLAQYQTRAYWRLRHKKMSGQVQMTPRIKRLSVVTVVLCVLGLGLPCLFGSVTVLVAHWCLLPYEHHVNRRWLRRAQAKIAAMPQLIKIGITGSYGKTSVKNILAALLAVKYRVVASPASFNTPLGLARTVNEHVTPDTQVLIMEMGARRPGEIRALCQLLPPDHAIITSIGACHLQTFGDIATVAATKAELFAALPATGLAVTDGDNPWCAQLKHPRLTLVSRQSPDYATSLLGAHQQTNIKLAVAIAHELGLTDAELRPVIAHLTPTPHRLQPLIAPNGIIILDDSYNANPTSAEQALAVLATYPGRKVVQTPGFVEQGTNATPAHLTFCQQIRAVADAVIVVGQLNRADFQTGLAGWARPVFYVDDREAAKKKYPQLLNRGDVLLIINDLPEQY